MYHYDAFISYNHNPRDIKVTQNLQHKLENFRLPKGTKTSTGKEKISRVFLDSGELEAAGDLSKVLQDALDNADDLIVICSPESKASIWVRREIEYFLQSHSIDRIHTVLTDGEPIDVLPEVLLYEEKEDEDGNTVRVPREPLSCDYRMPLKQANRRELPRLVAAIVGCRYDDLVQRQKQYRMKRQIAALAIAAVFLSSAIGYLVWSNHKIKENLDNTLREESINLAIQSEQALARGDRIGAIRLAIEALPSEGNERPVVPRAVKALTNALDLYKTPSAEGWSAVRQYESKGNFVDELRSAVVGDRTFFAQLFSNGAVAIWDADTGAELLADYTADLESIQNISFTEDGQLIMVAHDTIYIVDPAQEKEIKKISAGNERWFTTYSHDELPVHGSDLWITVVHYDEDYNSIYELARVDLDKGQTAEVSPVAETPKYMEVSPDGRYLAYVMDGYRYIPETDEEIREPEALYIADTQDTDSFGKPAVFKKPVITDINYIDDTKLVVSGLDEKPDDSDLARYQSMDNIGYGYRMMYSMAKERGVNISAIDAASGSQLWERGYTIFGSGTGSLIPREEGQTGWDAVFVLGDTVIVLDGDGGEVARFNTSANVRAFYNRDDMIRVVTYGGDLSAYTISEASMVTMYNRISGPVDTTEISDSGYIFVTSSDTTGMSSAEMVTQYAVRGSDEAWEPYEYGDDTKVDGKEYDDVVAIVPASDGRFVEIREDMFSSFDEEDIQILVRDSASGEILLNKLIRSKSAEDFFEDYADIEDCDFDYSGLSESGDKIYFAYCDFYSNVRILTVDLQDGSEQVTELSLGDPEDEYGEYDLVPSGYSNIVGVCEFSVYGGRIHYLARHRKEVESEDWFDYEYDLLVLSIDPETGDAEEHVIKQLGDNEHYGSLPCRVNGACGRVICLDTDEEESVTGMTCYDFNGKTLWSNDSIPENVSGLLLTDDGQVIIMENLQGGAVIRFYSAKDGKETSAEQIDGVELLSSEELGFCVMSDDECLLTTGNDAYILDNETYEVRTVIAGAFVAYDPVNRLFMLGNSNSQETGHVPYRTLDEIMEMGRSYLPAEDADIEE